MANKISQGDGQKVYSAVEGLKLLAEGKEINYEGASGPLDFDPSLGEAPADFEIWCVQRDARGSLAFGVPQGYYDYRNASFTGQITCDL